MDDIDDLVIALMMDIVVWVNERHLIGHKKFDMCTTLIYREMHR